MSPEADNVGKITGAASHPIILTFHKLSPRFSYGVTNFTPIRFLRLIGYLEQTGYNLTADFNDSQSWIGDTVFISFDDGYQHLVENLLPIMRQRKLKPLILLPTALIGHDNRWDYSYIFRKEKHLDCETVSLLSKHGAIFGSHGHHHRSLISMQPEDLRRELALSKSVLDQLCEKPTYLISYPFGLWNRRVIETAGECGFTHGLTMNFPTSNDQALTLGRYPVYAYDTHFSIKQKITKGAFYGFERLKAAATNRLSRGTILFNRALRRGGGEGANS